MGRVCVGGPAAVWVGARAGEVGAQVVRGLSDWKTGNIDQMQLIKAR